ncbi:MAG: monofunctional biosynthetic peptidoglycan transglycosylase [Alphaproteobacteria bacterium]|nr:monofunctional biosynthetic peptidoglycan transglycosylase [Alphaproteobacteria bacterium]
MRQKLKTFWHRRARWQKALLGLAGFLLAWPLVMTLVYGVVPVPFSNVMLLRLVNGNGLHKQWVSMDRISPELARAVVSSEDQRFCSHHGVDWIEFQDALDSGDEGPSRGASTISMQVAKNMFLWDGRSFIRKGLEMPLAYYMDGVLTKRRMMEIYLNIAEWAPGIYGAEAAAQYHFGKPAAKLTRREAALLAAVLPNPIKRQAGKPSAKVNAIAQHILDNMDGIDAYLACLGQNPQL